VVEEVGPGVARLRPGDLVVPSVRRPCPRPDCPACRSGNQDFCVTGQFTERGLAGAHGFLAERIVEEEEYLYRMPAALREVGVLTEPLTIAEKGLRQYLAVQRRLPWLEGAPESEVLAGKRAVVLGAGPVGILGCMLLRARGCEVWVYSREPASAPRAALVESTGAVYRSSTATTVSALAAEVGGIDLVYEAAGSPALAFDVLQYLARNGVFVLTGVPRGGGPIEIQGDPLMTGIVVRNAMLVGTVNAGREDFVAAIRDLEAFVAAWPDAVRGIITGRHQLADFCRCATDRSGDGIKEIIALGVDL
jgi:glucose 1-dehydrogenase